MFAAVLLIFVFLDSKKLRTAGAAVFAVFLILSAVISFRGTKTEILLPEGTWSAYTDEEGIVSVGVSRDKVEICGRKDGGTYLHLSDENGTERLYYVTVTGLNVYASPIE